MTSTASAPAIASTRDEPERARLAALKGLLEIRAGRVRCAKIHRTHRGAPLDFSRYPYLRALYEEHARKIVVMKCTQVGCSEWLIVTEIAAAGLGYQVLAYLPDKGAVSHVVQERVNKPLRLVPEYRALLDGAIGETDRVGLKQLGQGAVYFLSTRDPDSVYSLPGDVLIVDELDQCDAEILSAAPDRLNASAVKLQIRVGNPTVAEYGIAARFSCSDRREWHVVCPRCSLAQPLEWAVNVVEEISDPATGQVRDWKLRDRAWRPGLGRDLLALCRNCHEPLDRLERSPKRAFWRPLDPGRPVHGYHLSLLLSPDVSLSALWEEFQAATSDPTRLQRFFNLKLGVPYSAPGSKLTREVLDGCRDLSWRMPTLPPAAASAVTAGVDVGRMFHVRISERLDGGIRRALFVGRIASRCDLVALLLRFRVRSCVLDALPELHQAKEIAAELARSGVRVHRCEFASEDSASEPKIDEPEGAVRIGRTLLLDAAAADILDRRNVLPADAPLLDEGAYYAEMGRNSRVPVETAKGVAYRWTDEKPNDHRFADAYDWLAGHPALTRVVFFSLATRIASAGPCAAFAPGSPFGV